MNGVSMSPGAILKLAADCREVEQAITGGGRGWAKVALREKLDLPETWCMNATVTGEDVNYFVAAANYFEDPQDGLKTIGKIVEEYGYVSMKGKEFYGWVRDYTNPEAPDSEPMSSSLIEGFLAPRSLATANFPSYGERKNRNTYTTRVFENDASAYQENAIRILEGD